MHHLNLVAATTPVCIDRLEVGSHDLVMSLDAIPITPTEVELSVVVTDERGLVLDEASCSLDVGEASLRPRYRLNARMRSRSVGVDTSSVGAVEP